VCCWETWCHVAGLRAALIFVERAVKSPTPIAVDKMEAKAMKPVKPIEEVVINVQITPNEVIAVNLAIGYFLSRCRHVSPVYEEASELLARYQRRVTEQLPPRPQPEVRH